MDSAAGEADSGLQDTPVDVSSLEGGQQGGVDVEEAALPARHKVP